MFSKVYSINCIIYSSCRTKMCIKFAPNSWKLGFEYGAFFGALVLMLITNFIPNSTIRSSGTNFMQICLKQYKKTAFPSLIEQKGLTFDHDFCKHSPFLLPYFFKIEEKRGKNNQSRSQKSCISARSLHLYIPLQKIGANKVSDLRIKVLALKCKNIQLGVNHHDLLNK